jgi:hypothetical protein
MINYPPDWPCKNCKRSFEKHLEGTRRWCFKMAETGYKNPAYQWFEPIDNLTMIEHLAKEKELI